MVKNWLSNENDLNGFESINVWYDNVFSKNYDNIPYFMVLEIRIPEKLKTARILFLRLFIAEILHLKFRYSKKWVCRCCNGLKPFHDDFTLNMFSDSIILSFLPIYLNPNDVMIITWINLSYFIVQSLRILWAIMVVLQLQPRRPT